MNMKEPMNDQDLEREDDRELRELLRQASYEGRPRDEFKRQLRQQLDHNFSYHRRRNLAVVTALVVLVGSAALLRTTDVGSDSFDLLDTGRTTGTSPIFRAPMGGTGYSYGKPGASVDELRQAMEQVHEQFAAGTARLTMIEGWSIGGRSAFYGLFDTSVDGEVLEVSRSLNDKKPEFTLLLIAFNEDHEEAFLADIESGVLPRSGSELVDVGGYRLVMTRWEREVPGYGLVTYWRGFPDSDR